MTKHLTFDITLGRVAATGLVARLLAVLLMALAPLTAGANDYETPEEMVRDTSDAVLDLIEEARGYVDEDPERFYRQVESILLPVVDFQSFARSVMAAHYRKATPQQRERFIDSFRSGLVRTYAMALMEFDNGKVVVVPPDRPPRDPARRTVRMEVHTAAGDVYPVLYSVTQDDDGEWQVRNLIVNGVNMGLTYRNQFNSAMNNPRHRGDIDSVIDAWADLLEAAAPDFEAGGAGQES
ncbi:MAG: MlaC/ttg2D family ABC transporter substrate-binding protein [Pseudomonadales bacterium]